jgi:hypothetical protein
MRTARRRQGGAGESESVPGLQTQVAVVNRTIINRGNQTTPRRFALEVVTRDVASQLQISSKSSKDRGRVAQGEVHIQDEGPREDG